VQLVLNANACSFAKLCCCAFFALIFQPCVLGGVSGLVALSGRGRRVNELGPGVILCQGLQSWRKPLHLLPRLFLLMLFSVIVHLEMRDIFPKVSRL